VDRTRLAAVACVALIAGCAGTVRYSQNPIGRAQFVGVAVCDDLRKAQRAPESARAPYPVYFRTDHQPLRARGPSGVRGAPFAGRTWTSGLHEAMGLTERDEPFVVLVTDRRGRIRAFTAALGGAAQPEADPATELNGVVEDLLLNLDGAELITRHPRTADAAAPVARGGVAADLAFQTDLDRAALEGSRGGPGKGAPHAPMRLLGKPLPDWTVRDAAGKKVSLRAVAAGRVTVVAVFLADDGSRAELEPAFAELRAAWRAFGEGRARPGPRWVANARPDAP
jgi:hypothetical protein